MKNYIFFHVAIMNNVVEIFNELFNELIKSNLINNSEKIFIYTYGSGDISLPSYYNIVIINEKDINLGEKNTLNKIYDFSKNNKGNILYIHTKGVTDKFKNPCITDWRKYMTYFNINKWEDCIEKLKEYDVCGVDLRNNPVKHYSGNFWWSNTEYIKKLNIVDNIFSPLTERHKCEFWITSSIDGKYYSMWDCGIDVYERHLHRYERYKYVE